MSTVMSSVSTCASGAPPARMSDASYLSDAASTQGRSFHGRRWSFLDDEYAQQAAASPELSEAEKAQLLARIAATKERIDARVARVLAMVEAIA